MSDKSAQSSPSSKPVTTEHLEILATHLERIALDIIDGKLHLRAGLDAHFLVIAAEALREIGGQMLGIAKLGHQLQSESISKIESLPPEAGHPSKLHDAGSNPVGLASSITSNQCDVCGKPATQWMADPWGKSSVTRAKCAEHGLRLRDPADVAEIERLTKDRTQFVQRLADCEISLGAFDPGAASEYWLKYAPGAMHASAHETLPTPVEAGLASSSSKERVYMCIRVLEDGEHERATHFRVVDASAYEAATVEIARLEKQRKALEVALDWAFVAVLEHYDSGEAPNIPGAFEELEKSRERIIAAIKPLDTPAETAELPESLRDPIEALDRGRKLLIEHEAVTRSAMLDFLGWLRADIPQLQSVAILSLLNSWDRYRSQLDQCLKEDLTEQCPRCRITLEPGTAIQSTLVKGMSDFIGEEKSSVETVYVGGPGRVINVLKCPSCGYSRTPAKPEQNPK